MKRLFQTFGLAAIVALMWLAIRTGAQPVTVNGAGGSSGGGVTNLPANASGALTNDGAGHLGYMPVNNLTNWQKQPTNLFFSQLTSGPGHGYVNGDALMINPSGPGNVLKDAAVPFSAVLTGLGKWSVFSTNLIDAFSTLASYGVNPGTNLLNAGAAFSGSIPFLQGSVSSADDMPVLSADMIHSAMPGPIMGIVPDNAFSTPVNPWPMFTNNALMIQAAIYFRTSGITQFLTNWGSHPAFVSDDGWQGTNRDANGYLTVDAGVFPNGLSSQVNAMHTNGMWWVPAIYQTTQFPNAGDTSLNSQLNGANVYSFPSGATASNVTNTFPVMTPNTMPVDILLLQTNLVDALLAQDVDNPTSFHEVQGGEYQRALQLDHNVLYPYSLTSGRVSWTVYTNNGAGIIGPISTGLFGQAPQLGHQMGIGMFYNHPASFVPYVCNFWTPDQPPASVGTDTGLGFGMQYITLANEVMSNWPAGCFPFMTFNSLNGGTGFSSSTYSNYYACVGEVNGCSFSRENTNMFNGGALFAGWETNQNVVVTNIGFLNAWQDVEHFPRRLFWDGTNSVWIRKYGLTPGAYIVLAVNQGAVTTNLSVSLLQTNATTYGSIGLISNVIYAATNVFEQNFAGFVTNTLTTNLVNATKSWMTLSPVSQSVSYLNAPNNTASINIVSNFTPVATILYTNMSGCMVDFEGSVSNLNCWPTAGSASGAITTLNYTNNGVGAPGILMGTGEVTGSTQTNGGYASFQISLGPNDTFQFSTNVVGTGSKVVFLPAVLKSHP